MTPFLRSCLSALVLPFLCFLFPPAQAGEALPAGFVHLRAVDPTIEQAIRYAGSQNFTGRPVPGYEAAECILTDAAARALAKVQADLASEDIGLKVFDCYRPVSAVAAFVRWAGQPEEDPALKARYHPKISKAKLFDGYIAKRSGHSRGSTVDLTLVGLSRPKDAGTYLRDGCVTYEKSRELDMGTGFDCMDPRSNTESRAISAEARKNRDLLVAAMRRRGFRNYAGEWWHFSYRGEPFPRTYFDFPVTALPLR